MNRLSSNPSLGRVLTLLLLALYCTCGRAQQIQLNVIVPEPPPVYWDAYLEFNADIRVILTNTSRTAREVKLIPNLTSDRGLAARFSPDFQPLSPITVPGGGTVSLTYRDLGAIFGRPTEGDIELSGIDFDRLYESETIPEGSYTLCVEARDFDTDELLSNNFGCDVFYVRQYEPPIIITPQAAAQVVPTDPQFVNFLWSTTGVPGRTRYRFRLFDLDELGLFNAADAFVLETVRPLYEEEDLVANTLAYGLGYPELLNGHHYAVQVIAYDPEGTQLFAQNGVSEQVTFHYQQSGVVLPGGDDLVINNDGGGDDPQANNNNDDPNDLQNPQDDQQQAMQFNCPPLPPPTPVPYPNAIGANATITVGGFQMEVVSGGGMSPISGTGRVFVDAFNTWVNVTFSNLAINTELEAYGGAVVHAVDGSGLIPAGLLTNLGEGEFAPDELAENTAQQLADYVSNQGNWLNPEDLGIHPALNLPAGVAGGGMELILTGMEFSPTGAVFSTFAKIDLPEAQGNRRLLLIGRGMCLAAENLGQGANLLLAADKTFALSDGLDLTFLGGEDATSVSWSQNGIETFNVHGRLTFDQSLIATNGQPLTASFTAEVEDYQDWTATVTLNQNAWHLPGLEDFGLELLPGTIVYDHSAVNGPPGFDLPGSHPLAGNEALWQGVYLPGLNFSFPEGIDAEVEIEDIIIDQQGAWLDLEINTNFLPFADGADLGNWPLELNQLTLDIRASSVESAGFGGRIKLPISGTAVDFTTPIGGDGNFSFAVALEDALTVNMWVAQLDLEPNSSIGVSKEGNAYRPVAVLNGTMAIGFTKSDGLANSAVGDFSLPGIDFENFTVTGGPGVPQLSGSFGLDLEDNNEQGALANFPFQLNGVDVNLDAGVTFDLGLKLTQMANGFEGGTVFTVNGEWDVVQKRFKYKNTQLNAISVDANVGVMSLEGDITFYNGDPTYGDGFDGAVSITINPISLTADMQLMVGKMPSYRYFMIDASIKLGAAAIPLGPSGLALQGFGGGFYMNMERQFDEDQAWTMNDATGTMENPDLGPDRGIGGSGATYVPDDEFFGFSAKVIFSTIGLPSSLNADVGFGMELSNEFGLSKMWMEGNAYVMQSMTNRDGGALISGGAYLNMDFLEDRYTFGGNLQANILGFLQLNIPLECYYSPSDWHFYLGKWTPTANPNDYDYATDPGRFNFTAGFDFQVASVQTGLYGYFMMGTDLPSGLPPKPLAIRNMFQQSNKPLPSANLPEFLTTSKGFAFGMVNDFHLAFDVLIFKLKVDYIMGLDVLMENKVGQECNYDEFGINRWYGRGQAYAYLGIKGAVGGKIFGKYREFVFAQIEAAAALDFKGPKPVWIKGQAAIKGKVLGGLIDFNTQVEFEHGEQVICETVGTNIFDDIPIVQDFDPRDGTENKSVFIHPQIAFNFPRGSFGIEEESDTPGEPITRYYGYQIVSFKVRTKEQGGSWKNHPGGVGTADYDNAGYSCSYDLPQQLPEFSQVEVEITVRGLRLHSDDINDVAETFSSQSYKATFTTGEAPDYILPNSIDLARPFHRQRYFQKDEVAGDGFINFWVEQSNKLFRQHPGPNDGFDSNGNYNYVVRFTDVESGAYTDRTPTNRSTAAGGGFNFAIPRAFLQPERIYKIDLLRLFQPPAVGQEDNTNVVMTNLGIDGPNPGPGGGGGVGGILVNPGQNQGGNGGGGGGLVIQGQLANQQAPNAGLFQVAQFQGGGANQYTINNGQPDPDPPAPNFPTQLQGNGGGGGPNPPWVNPNLGFQQPGGSMAGLKYAARNIKERGKVDQVIVKSLMPPSQPFYFRTSKYNTATEKLNATSVKQLNSPKYQTHLVDTDNLHYAENGVEVKTPYVFLQVKEGFDRFETQYHRIHWVVSDLGDVIDAKWQQYSPALEINGDEDWRTDVFLGGSQNGLMYPPFQNSDNAWCSENFYDPDGYFDEGPVNDWNPPLHSGTPTVTPWWAYQAASPNEMEFSDQRRYRHDAPFGKRPNRRLPAPSEGNSYEFQLATIEFLQHTAGSLPNSLNGVSVEMINTFLTPAEYNAALPPAPPPPPAPGSGVLVLNVLPDLGGNTPAFTINNGGGIQPVAGQYVNVGGGNNGGGNANPNLPGPGQYAAQLGFIPLVDFTEWMTYKDYVLFRQLVDEGIFEMADLSETMPGQSLNYVHNPDIYCDDDDLDLPTDPAYNNADPEYNFYRRYYLPIRAYFKLEVNDGYFPYPARPAGEGSFKINNRQFTYQTPSLND